MTSTSAKKLTVRHKIVFFLCLSAVILVSVAIPVFCIRSMSGAGLPEERPAGVQSIGFAVFLLVTGYFFILAGLAIYGLCLATHCFTFNFNKPYFNSFKIKIWILHILTVTPFCIGAGLLLSIVLLPVLSILGVPFFISFPLPVMAALLIVQFAFSYIDLWKPLESMIVRRLSACGISRQDLDRGLFVGISDPSRSSFKKLTLVEEDMGMLWIEPEELRYIGDTDQFRIRREQFIELERAADKGSVSAYFGNVAVILRFQTPEGTERRVRLHPESGWTMSGRAKLSEQLAQRILTWQQPAK